MLRKEMMMEFAGLRPCALASALLACALGLAASAAGAQAPSTAAGQGSQPVASQPAVTSRPATPERIAELVKALGDDDFTVREAAQNALAEMGLAAKAELEKAAESEDIEVRERTAELLRDIAHREADARSLAIAREVLWSLPIKGGATALPILAGKTLIAVGEEGVYAVSIVTGKKLWTSEAKTDWRLAVSGSVVAVGDDEKVQALDLETGKVKWKHQAFGGRRPEGLTSDDSAIYVNDQDGKMIALSPGDGKVLWKADSLSSVKPLIRAGEAILAAGNENNAINRNRPTQIFDSIVLALDAASGKELWRFKSDAPFACMSAGDDAVYILRQTDLLAVELASGKQLWTYKLPQSIAGSFFRMVVIPPQVDPDTGPCRPVVSGGLVYVLHGQYIVGVDAKSGDKAVEFKMELPAGKGEVNLRNSLSVTLPNGTVRVAALGYLAVDGQTAYLQRGTMLAAIDLKGGKVLWAVGIGGMFSGMPVLADGRLYFGTRPIEAPPAGDKEQADVKDLKLELGAHALKVKGL